MSASREKKKRQDLLSGSTDPRTAREAEQMAADKRANALYAAFAIGFVILAIVLVVYNSGIIERSKTAVTIGDEKFTVAQASYYYQQAYQNFLNSENGYIYQAYGMIDTNSPLKDQAYDDTRSWADYFKEQAVEDMKFIHLAKAAAQDAGMTLEKEDMDTYSENLSALKKAAASAGYTYRAYLSAIYGAPVTAKVYESCEKDRLLAAKYATSQRDSYSFTDEEIQAYYEENKDTYDLVDGAYVTVSGTPESKTDDDGNAVEATEEEKTAAMEAARQTAEDILAAYQNGGDLEELATEHDASYTGNEEMQYSSGVSGDWLFDSARRPGDAEVLEDESGSRYYVALFHGRERNEALNYNVRHILVTDENLDLPEGEEAEEGQLEAKAQEILDSWDGTEDGFASLAGQYSQDAGSKDNGGLYEDVAKGDMVAEFNDWCYEDGRKAGDTGIVSTSYGQHIMYFVGYTDTQYWHKACEDMLISNAYSDWYNEAVAGETAILDESGMNSIGA